MYGAYTVQNSWGLSNRYLLMLNIFEYLLFLLKTSAQLLQPPQSFSYFLVRIATQSSQIIQCMLWDNSHCSKCTIHISDFLYAFLAATLMTKSLSFIEFLASY